LTDSERRELGKGDAAVRMFREYTGNIAGGHLLRLAKDVAPEYLRFPDNVPAFIAWLLTEATTFELLKIIALAIKEK
jgi:hypothetical protein